jgi:hypothetical protein
LAEEAGILAGNGYLFDDTQNYHTGFDVYGNLYDDFPYLEFYVKPLIERLNNVRVRTYVHPLSSTVILQVNSADALRTKAELGLSVGRKTNLRIPRSFSSRPGPIPQVPKWLVRHRRDIEVPRRQPRSSQIPYSGM